MQHRDKNNGFEFTKIVVEEFKNANMMTLKH